jgi:hypothetical protein
LTESPNLRRAEPHPQCPLHVDTGHCEPSETSSPIRPFELLRSTVIGPLQGRGAPRDPVDRLGAGHYFGHASQGRWRGQTIGATHAGPGTTRKPSAENLHGSLTPINPPIARASAPAIRPAVSLRATVLSSPAMRRSCASFFAAKAASMVSTLACRRPKGEAAKVSGGAGYPGPQSTRPGPGRPPIAGVEPPRLTARSRTPPPAGPPTASRRFGREWRQTI